MKNNNCQFERGCTGKHSETRVLPGPGEGNNCSNSILCRAHYDSEIEWRKYQNRKLAAELQYDLPVWESLEVYSGAF